MDGRFPRGILYTLSNIPNASSVDEFNYWYNYIHIPDLTDGGIVQQPTRYEMLSSTSDKFEGGRFLDIWEVDRIDIGEAVQESLGNLPLLRKLGRMWPVSNVVWSQPFRSIGPLTKPGGKCVTGILLALTRCTDPANEEEFNHWYDTVHVRHVLDTGLFHTGYRFESYYTPKTGEPKYLAIYETAAQDPAAAEAELISKHQPQWRARREYSPYMEVVWRGCFRRIFPDPGK